MKVKSKLFRLHLIAIIVFSLSICLNGQGLIIQAEDGTLVGEHTRIEQSQDGYSGTGYVTGFEADGDAVVVTANMEKEGDYTISLGFSSPLGPKQNFVSINGITVDTADFPEILIFSEQIIGDFHLNAGANTIGFHNYWGWCNLDYFKISDISPRGDFNYNPLSPATGDTITFDASAAYDPNGTIVSYNWDFNGESTSTGMITKYTFTSEGVKTISLTLTDNDGNTSQIINQFAVSRAEPYAVFSYSEEFPEPNISINFNGGLSYDLTGTVDSWEWDFGDGNTASGKNTSHTFTTEGNFEVSLTVTNNRGKSDTRKEMLFVYNSDVVLRGPSLLTNSPKTNEKIEFNFQVKANYTNPYNPDEVLVDAVVVFPNGVDSIIVPCFYYEKAIYQKGNWGIDTTIKGWRLRLSVGEIGDYSLKLRYSGNLIVYDAVYNFTVTKGTNKGIVTNDATNNQYYRHSTGEPFYPMGINIGWNSIGSYFSILDNISSYGANLFRYWHTPFAHQALEWQDNGFTEGLGIYNQEAAGMTDSLINMGGNMDVYMQLVFFQHGPFSENVNPIWNENPYNSANGGFVDRAEEFFYNNNCKHYTKKLLRYIVARWGYSPNIFAWEFFNEVQFTGIHPSQTAQWYTGIQQWHSEMSSYVESIDPFNHIMTTSADHNQLYDFDSIANLDVVQYHLYDANLLTQQKNFDSTFKEKLQTPIINGEYGEDVTTADVPIDKQQTSLWNSIMTEVPHIMWLWDNYHKEAWGSVFYYPTTYLQDEDLSQIVDLKSAEFIATMPGNTLETTGLSNDSCIYGVVYDLQGDNIQGAHLEKVKLPFANYDIKYYIAASDEIIIQTKVPLIREENIIALPASSNDIAFKIKYNSAYTLPIAVSGADQLISLGSLLTLDGSRSVDPNDLSLNYSWKIINKPALSNLAISNGSLATITLTPEVSGFYYFELTVNNGTDFSLADTVLVICSTKPMAVAGGDLTVKPRRTISLDGSNSYDSDGESLTYLWKVIESPSGSKPDIYNYTDSIATFRSDSLGIYIVILTVNDGIQSSEPDTVLVTVAETTSIEAISANRINLFPNPAKDYLNLNIVPGNGTLEFIKIIDVSGRVVHYQPIEQYNAQMTANLKIELNNIKGTGLYLIQLSFDSGVFIKSFIIM